MSEPADPELEILREAERKRGGCGAFLAGGVVFFVIFVPLMMLTEVDGWLVRRGLVEDYVPLVLMAGRFGLAVAGGVAAAKGFNRLRLRMGKKGSPPA